MARPGSSAVGPGVPEMTTFGRHISVARASVNSRVPSASAPMFSRRIIHLAQSAGEAQMPPAAAAESQSQIPTMLSEIFVIGPW